MAVVFLSFAARANAKDPLLEPPPRPQTQLASWDEAVTLFSSRSTDLQINAGEVVRAAARHRVALAGVLPSLNGSALASFSLLQPPPGADPSTAALFGAAPYQTLTLVAQLSVIDLRSWNAIAAASDAERATKLSVEDARRLLLLNLAQSLLSEVTAERLAELSRAGLADAIERLTLAERANRAGASTELDLGRLRQDAETARAAVVTADETLRQSREALGLALGVEEPVAVSPSFQLDGLAAQLNSCKQVTALALRADQLAATARTEVAHRSVLDAKAQFLPTLGVRSTASAFLLSGSAIPIWNLQAVLTVPIWDGGARYGALRDAEAQERQAEARQTASRRQGAVDVERARRGVDVAQRSRELAAAALEHATKTEALTRKAFDAGLGTSLELVTAASSLRAQQLNVALKDYDVLRARVVALFALADCTP
ncbi:MAG: TolC family protein [Archangium sp.]